jgi:acetyl esterase
MNTASLSGRDRLLAGIARFLCGLPPPLQRALAGRPVEIEGLRLAPEIQLLLRLTNLSPEPDLHTQTPDQARMELRRLALALEGPKIVCGHVEQLEVPGPAGPIGARLYVPEPKRSPQPLLVYLHGGGWVRGDLDTHDNPCRFLAHQAGVTVLSVDYRLAPEHKFPAAVEDSFAAFHFAAEHAEDLGADPDAIAVGGDSAGGNLTAVVSQLAKADGGAVPAFLLMFYPATDFSVRRRSFELFREGFLLTESDVDWYESHYLPDGETARDPRASPLLTEDLSGLPPAYIATAGFDVLRDEGEAYAARLRDAGVPVALRRHTGLIHGFANMIGIGRTGRAAMHEVAGALRMGLASRAASGSRVA